LTAAAATKAGFSVLEALVALALLAAALLPLYALQSSAGRAALAVERAHDRLALDRLAMNHLDPLNPALHQSGELAASGGFVRWRAEPYGPSRPIVSVTGQAGRFRAQMYRIRVEIAPQHGAVREWSMDRIGWTASAGPLRR